MRAGIGGLGQEGVKGNLIDLVGEEALLQMDVDIVF